MFAIFSKKKIRKFGNYEIYFSKLQTNIYITRKYPLRGYFLGVLMHTTAWDRL